MVAAIAKNFPSTASTDTLNDVCTILNMEISTPSLAQWYNGIIAEESKPAKEMKIKVRDKGSSVEFVLPSGTAQFAEMTILDKDGNLVWKTQSYNNSMIVWHKQTSIGGKVPQGSYTLQMKQGDLLARGVAVIS